MSENSTTPEGLVCRKCNEWRPIARFYKCSTTGRYRTDRCATCIAKRILEARHASKELQEKARKRSRKEGMSEEAYASKLERASEWAKGNRERLREYHREYYRKNNDKWRPIQVAKCYKRKALIAANGGHHSRKEWADLLEKYGHKCLACGTSDRLTKDHVIPLTLGGSDSIDNLQPLCRSCNTRKHNDIIDYRSIWENCNSD